MLVVFQTPVHIYAPCTTLRAEGTHQCAFAKCPAFSTWCVRVPEVRMLMNRMYSRVRFWQHGGMSSFKCIRFVIVDLTSHRRCVVHDFSGKRNGSVWFSFLPSSSVYVCAYLCFCQERQEREERQEEERRGRKEESNREESKSKKKAKKAKKKNKAGENDILTYSRQPFRRPRSSVAIIRPFTAFRLFESVHKL